MKKCCPDLVSVILAGLLVMGFEMAEVLQES